MLRPTVWVLVYRVSWVQSVMLTVLLVVLLVQPAIRHQESVHHANPTKQAKNATNPAHQAATNPAVNSQAASATQLTDNHYARPASSATSQHKEATLPKPSQRASVLNSAQVVILHV